MDLQYELYVCSTSNSLLKTSYVKMIDLWYFGTLCVPFVEVLLSTYINTVREEIQQKRDQHVAIFHAREGSRINRVRPKVPVESLEQKVEDQNILEDLDKSMRLLGNLRWFQRKILPSMMLVLVMVYFAVGFLSKQSDN